MKLEKYGIDFFDNRLEKYGGHSHWLGKFFKNYSYACFYLCGFRIGYFKEYYDGYHYAIFLGFVVFSWGK